MQLRKATEQDKKESIKIAQNLKEWFNKKGLNNMKIDFKLNNLVVARDKDKVSGFLCYTSNCGKMQLIWMGVKRDAQERGIGKKLLKWLEKESK